MDAIVTTPEVDLLTMSPSQAQQHLQTERIKRKQSGRDRGRRSSLSKGLSVCYMSISTGCSMFRVYGLGFSNPKP